MYFLGGSESLEGHHAGLAQLIERKFTKLQVAGLSPASRSEFDTHFLLFGEMYLFFFIYT